MTSFAVSHQFLVENIDNLNNRPCNKIMLQPVLKISYHRQLLEEWLKEHNITHLEEEQVTVGHKVWGRGYVQTNRVELYLILPFSTHLEEEQVVDQ